MKRALLCLIVAISLVAPTPRPAEAHPPGPGAATVMMVEGWAGYTSVPWGFVQGFPANTSAPAGARDRVKNGHHAWNDLASPFTWAVRSTDYTDYNPNPAANGCPGFETNGVHWKNLSGTTLGQTWVCTTSSGKLHSAAIVIDCCGRNWYTGTGTPPPSTPTLQFYDMWSVAAHEVGHAVGFNYGVVEADGLKHGHFDEAGSYCTDEGGDSPTRMTMCPTIDWSATDWRTPELHDTHTFNALYP